MYMFYNCISAHAHCPKCLHIMMRFVYRICKCKVKRSHSMCCSFSNKHHHTTVCAVHSVISTITPQYVLCIQ